MTHARTSSLARPLTLAAGLVFAFAACSGTGAASVAPASAAPSAMAESSAMAEASAMAAASAMAEPSAMASGNALAMKVGGKGTFHAVDGTATGVAEFVQLANGTHEIILDQFTVAGIAHTNVVLVSNADVLKTTDIDPTKLLDLGPLKAKEGMQTYEIPAAMAGAIMDGYHTVVIWDTTMLHAIAAAPLK